MLFFDYLQKIRCEITIFFFINESFFKLFLLWMKKIEECDAEDASQQVGDEVDDVAVAV